MHAWALPAGEAPAGAGGPAGGAPSVRPRLLAVTRIHRPCSAHAWHGMAWHCVCNACMQAGRLPALVALMEAEGVRPGSAAWNLQLKHYTDQRDCDALASVASQVRWSPPRLRFASRACGASCACALRALCLARRTRWRPPLPSSCVLRRRAYARAVTTCVGLRAWGLGLGV